MKKIPLARPFIDDHEINAVVEVLKSGWYTHGPKNQEFEERFAAYLGVRHAISMHSCTSALFLAIMAQGITGEVIVPSFTFVASVNTIITAGAIPAFADVEYDTCNIDAGGIEAQITPRTEAIMPIHYAGQPCEMDRILQIAQRYGLAVIEDSAETIGGEFDGQKAGSFGAGCFSFFPTKNITTGEGGMLTTDDDQLAEKVRALLAHGISSTTFAREKQQRPWFRSASYAGYNFRMSNILAAIGVEQVKKLPQMNERRRQASFQLMDMLSDVEEIDLPVERPGRKHVFQMFTIKVKGLNREDFVHRLREKGISASVHFDPPVHQQEFYKDQPYSKVALPVTEQLASSIVTLPMYPGIQPEALTQVAQGVKQAIAELKLTFQVTKNID